MLRLDASTLVATTCHVEDCPDLGPQCSQSPAPTPYWHHVREWMNETALGASYGLVPWLALDGRFAVRVVDVYPTYTALDGTPMDVPNDIHHHRETLVGPADPWLQLRAGARSGKLLTFAQLGATLPLGSTVPDPYELSREGKWHEHVQFGSGTVVPVVGAGAAYTLGKVDLAASALGFFGLYANENGYRPPMRLFAVSRATLHLAGGWVPYVSLAFVHEGRDVWHGLYGDEAYERDDVLAGCGLGWGFARAWVAEAGVAFRVVQLGSGASFDYPGILQLAITTHIDGLR